MVLELTLDVMGVPVDLTLEGSNAQALTEAVSTAWSRCLTPVNGTADRAELRDALDSSSGRTRLRVVLDDDLAVVATARADGAVAGTSALVVLDELTTRLVREGLEAKVGDRWLLHACGLADPATGATAVLVAPSGTGKTTASRTLAATLGYVTDETAVVERDGSMTPFPKPLSLLVDGKRPKQQVSPDESAMLPAPAAPWMARVALLARDPEAVEVRIEKVATVEALAFLAEQTSSLHLLKAPLRTVAEMLQARGGLQRLVYAESADLAPIVHEWLATASRDDLLPAVSAAPHPEAAQDTAGQRPALAPGRLRRITVLDEYVEDGLMAVFAGGRVLALSAMASLLLLTIGDAGVDGLEITELQDFLEREVGLPDEMGVAQALVPLLDDLVENGLLERA